MVRGGYHFEGLDKADKKIIIDIAEVGGEYEVMAMTELGDDFDVYRTKSFKEAVHWFYSMMELYVGWNGNADENLAGDVLSALCGGKEVEDKYVTENGDDGTSNLDIVLLFIKKRKDVDSLVQTMKKIGIRCSEHFEKSKLESILDIYPFGNCQGLGRTMNVEAVAKKLRELGHQAYVEYRID